MSVRPEPVRSANVKLVICARIHNTLALNRVTLANLGYDYSVNGQLADVRKLLDSVKSVEINYDNRLIIVSGGVQ